MSEFSNGTIAFIPVVLNKISAFDIQQVMRNNTVLCYLKKLAKINNKILAYNLSHSVEDLLLSFPLLLMLLPLITLIIESHVFSCLAKHHQPHNFTYQLSTCVLS